MTYEFSCADPTKKNVGIFDMPSSHADGFYLSDKDLIGLKHTALASTTLVHELTHKVTHILNPNMTNFSAVVINVLKNIEEHYGIRCNHDSKTNPFFYGMTTRHCLFTSIQSETEVKDQSLTDVEQCHTDKEGAEVKLGTILNGTSLPTKDAYSILSPFSGEYAEKDMTDEVISYFTGLVVTGDASEFKYLEPLYEWFAEHYVQAAKAYIENSECCANIQDLGVAGITCVHQEPCVG